MKSPDNTDLFLRFQAGDQNAVKQVFHDYYPLMCQTIYRIIKDKDTAEDLAQNVFIRAWRKREQIAIHLSLSGYLRKMAINEALYYLRHQAKRASILKQYQPGPITTLTTPLDEVIRDETDLHIKSTIQHLPPRCRTIFQLNRTDGLSYREIAQRLDIRPKTVENQIAKALRILRHSLQAA
ncbi:MAG: RNA polymerase sigma-70 factor [Lewinella sp.]|jgi:RNA polymerase sigma-70 factor (ECF subfamily)|uniref:RNA polymerase sigma-70 factor n=1 Tax=Lewinella sp. TaxID=2004506 RepID=UPI003D6C0DB0